MYCDGRIERLDEQEYLEHSVRMGYPSEMQEQVQAACREIEILCQQRAYPFNHLEQVAFYQQIKGRAKESQCAP